MTKCTAAFVLCLIVAAGTALGQCEDPFDEVLCVAGLTPAEESSFSPTDGKLSDFWKDENWGSKDYIEMLPPGDCYPDRCGFDGGEDASFIVKAAATGKGLYVLAIAKDNVWVDRADAEDWGADAADLYFADLSSQEIATCTDCLIGLYSSALTYGTQQMQVWMGATSLPSGFRYAYYDENLWSWQTVELDWGAAKTLYGLEVEVVLVDANTKVQEWFFPWQRFGGGIAVGTALGGKKLAFSGGYNDKDGDNPDPHCLRWLGKDPWTIEDGETYWGDLLLADNIGSVEAVLDVKHAPSATRAPIRYGSGRGELYSLTGRRLPAAAAGAAAPRGVVVHRTIGSDGAAASRHVLVQ